MNKIILIVMALILVGCVSRSDVIRDNFRRDFRSSKSPGVLAVCIDRNADEAPLNIYRSKITSVGDRPTEVLIRNGDTIAAVVQIAAVDGGSNAAFYLGGVASVFPDTAVKDFTKGCE